MSCKSLPDTTVSPAPTQMCYSVDDIDMKELHRIDDIISSDTYLGTKMNRKALDFHTQLHEWSESKKLSTLSTKHSQLLTNAKTKDLHLPFQKLVHVDYWAKQVNRYYLPSKGARPSSGSFMKIDVSKYNMKVDKNEKPRSKSALYRPISAADRFSSNGRKRFFGTDVHTVNNNLIESQMHYSAQRKDLHSATTRKSTNLTRPQTADLSEIRFTEEPEEETVNESVSVSEKKESSKSNESDPQNSGHIETTDTTLQPQIVARSWSNRMLNVISIDDCKLTCRYRPQVIKENHAIPEDYDQMDRARANKVKKEVKERVKVDTKIEDMNGHEADDEGDNGEDVFHEHVGKVVVENSAPVYDSVVDTNNNTEADACHELDKVTTDKVDSKTNSEPNEGNVVTIVTDIKNNTAFDRIEEVNESGTNGSSSKGSSDKAEEKNSSEYDSKTSYGRLTTLYSKSETVKSRTKDRKRMGRTSKINYAIEDMVKDRKVMNSLERDFDSRTATYGRTIVEKSEGSEMFKKRHANLRKKIDNFVNTNSAVKTQEFYEKRRCNSARSSIGNL